MTQIKLAKSSFNTFTDHLGMNNWSSDDVDKLEIPDLKKYKEIVKQCKFFYRRDPLAASILNKLIEIGITKLSFGADGLSANELIIFTSISDKLMEFAEICALEFLLSGLVIPEIRYEPVSEDELIDLGIKKYTTLTLPISMWVRDPSTVKIEVPIIPYDPSYYVVIPLMTMRQQFLKERPWSGSVRRDIRGEGTITKVHLVYYNCVKRIITESLSVKSMGTSKLCFEVSYKLPLP